MLAVAILGWSPAGSFARAPQPAEAAGKRYALLIGVQDYDVNELHKLRFAEADVTVLADTLREGGYDPVNIVLMTRAVGAMEARFLPLAQNIRKELDLLLAGLGQDDSLVIALAGHGIQFQGEDGSYFCPMDAKLADRSTLIALKDVYSKLEKCSARLKVLLVDACRNDPRTKTARGRAEVDLESVTRPQVIAPPGGVVALFGCSAGEQTQENEELQHCVFFYFIDRGLKGEADFDRDGQVSAEELALYAKGRVRDFVRAKNGIFQVPELVGTARGLTPLAVPSSLATDPASIAHRRGIALAEQKDYKGAIAAFSEALAINPKLARALRDRGNAYTDSKDYARAFADFESAFALSQVDPLLFAYRAKAHSRVKQYDLAIADCNEAIRLDLKLARAYNTRGYAYFNKGEKDPAISDYNEAIRLDPKYALAYTNRGYAYYQMGAKDRAVADYDEAIRLDPKLASAYNSRGMVYKDRGDTDRAIADYDEAIRIDPNYANAYINRGNAYDKKSEKDRALTDYTEAIRLNSKLAVAYNNRGNVYKAKGDTNRAVADYDEAIRIDPKYANAYISRGNAYYAKGDYDRAIADYTEAIRLNPRFVLSYKNRALAYEKKGEPAKAQEDRATVERLENEAQVRAATPPK